MAGAPSSWRPPWLDRTTASTPTSEARTASSSRPTPLSMIGPSQMERSQSTSSQDRAGSNCSWMNSEMTTGVLPSATPLPVTLAKRTGSLRTKDQVQPGCNAPSTIVPSPMEGGMEKPRRTSRSRRPRTAVSTVSTRASKSASRARSTISFDQAPVPPGVDLEEQAAVADPPDLLDRAAAHRGQRVGQAGSGRSPGGGQLAVGVQEPGEAHRRQHERVGEWPAQQGRAHVDRLDLVQHPGPPAGRGVGGRVGHQGALVLGAAVHVVEHAPGQATPGDGPQVGDRGGLGQTPLEAIGLERLEADDRAEGLVGVGHRRPSSRPAGAAGRPRGCRRPR